MYSSGHFNINCKLNYFLKQQQLVLLGNFKVKDSWHLRVFIISCKDNICKFILQKYILPIYQINLYYYQLCFILCELFFIAYLNLYESESQGFLSNLCFSPKLQLQLNFTKTFTTILLCSQMQFVLTKYILCSIDNNNKLNKKL